MTRLLSAWLVATTLAVPAIVLYGQEPSAPSQSPNAHAIRLAAGTFTPSRGESLAVRRELTIRGYGAAERGYYIVQFAGPILATWRESVAAEGADILEYVPDFAFKVRMNPGQANRVQRLPYVTWVGYFEPAFKFGPRITRNGTRGYTVRLERGVDAAAAEAAVAATGASVVQRSGQRLVIAANSTQLDAVANVLDVAAIDDFLLVTKHNEFGGGNIMGASAVNANGFDGSTQTIAIADTGLGNGTLASAHPDLPASRIRSIFNWPGVPDACFDTIIDDGAIDVDTGHGTHVVTAALGSGNASGHGRGTAPGASLIFQAVENYAVPSLLCGLFYGLTEGYYLVGIPPNIDQLFAQGRSNGARIHSNSWGSEANSAYTDHSVSADQFLWSFPDTVLMFSAGNSGTDSNNDGIVDLGSINAPATAKNVISVGASENDRGSDWACDTAATYGGCAAAGGQNNIFTYGVGFADRFSANPLRDDPSAGNAGQIAAFSSRGPTTDGRIKPDVVAPGTWILSGYSDRFQEGYDPAPNPQNGLYQYDGWGFPLNQSYKYMGGTSMAAPLAAGGAAVVRDYYNKAHSHEASAALVKATLINSAVDLLDENNDGVDDNAFPIPNAHEGWGRVDLARATDGSHQFDDETVTLTTGASASFNYEVTSAGFPLRVTIVWTDFPSTTSAATNLVNDLDLQVIGPDGIPYRGNALVGGWSVAGGAADRVNNVENVYLPAASSGTWTITVNGYNVPFGFQPFALVVDGALAGAGTPLPSVRVVATDTSATEAGLTTGAFTFTRNGSTDAAMAVTYAVTGTATATTDYTALSGSITIPEGASDVTLLVQPIDDSTSEANETVVVSVVPGTEYGAGSPASATVTIVSDDLPPDLVLSSLTVPAATAPGATFSVSETTKNQGAAAASASETGFYLSLNLIFEPTDVFVGSRAVSALAPGAQEARTTSLVVPTTVAPGLYYLMARADWSNALLESQEGNNLRMSGGMRVGPDLLVSVLTVAASVAAGSTVPISDTTFNQGGGTASASVTAFYLSTNTGVDAADTLLGSRVVNSVAANAGHAASTSVTIPPATPVGIYYVLAVADHQAQVTEAHENNNVRASGQVKVGADLVVSALTAPGLAAAGAPISVSETTKNEGAGLAGASVTNFYLSPNVSYEATDTFLGQRIVPNLGPGVADSGSVSLTIPPSTVAGLYFVVGRADADDNVAETSEINNTRASAVVRVGPDLTVTTVTAPVVGGAGQTLTVTESIKNAGGDAAAASQSDFYLSIDPTLDASDVLLGNRAVPSIGAGATNTGPTTLMIPASTATGSYYVISKADATSVITEAQETNNTGRSATVRIGPDLIVTAFTGATTVTAGASLTVNDTVSNSGGAVAATTTTHFYLSTNALLDAADTLIGSRVVAELGPGMTETIATPLTFSASLPPATYYLFVKADGPGALVETNETNNTRVYAVRVIAP